MSPISKPNLIKYLQKLVSRPNPIQLLDLVLALVQTYVQVVVN